MKMLSVQVEDSFVKYIDSVVASSHLYSSRSEFLKDSMRKNISEILRMSDNLKKIREETRKLALKAKERGYDGTLLTRKEKDKIARAYVKKNNIKIIG